MFEQHINPDYISVEATAQLRQQFDQAQPYRHLVLDNFLTADFAEALNAQFPSIEKLKKHYNGLNERKSEGANFDDFPEVFRQARELIMGEQMAAWMSRVTGIEEVFVADDHLGTGLHQGSNGSFLDIHIDFNIHAEKDIHRRLNMLIYMNKDWLESYGGDLEMWDAKMTRCEKKVAPIFNRAVIFETSEISYHGYSKITVPEHITRKSIYVYFYTQLREGAASYHDTVFKAKPEDTAIKKVGTTVKETLKNFAKATLKRAGIKKL
jgi:Rps23 Pro-64 3,4-dihydroxylase Tpa1-like proline 4-hydroxylase